MTTLIRKTDTSERFILPFISSGLDLFSEDSLGLFKKRKVLDFYILPSKVTAKIQDDNSKMHLLLAFIFSLRKKKTRTITKVERNF